MTGRSERVLLIAALAAAPACGGDDDVPLPAPPVAPPWDDDGARLGHCVFEPAPERAARPALQPGPLRAGLGSAVLRMPIGTPMGGYGDRVQAIGDAPPPDARAPRWATAMTPTVGMHDAPRAEALALEAGGETFVLLRVDAPFITENALFELEAALDPGGSLRGRVMLTASHSHAAWAAWTPTFHLVPGNDRVRPELLARAIEAMRDAAGQALDGLEAARVGFGVDAAFDPADRVGADRRGDNDAVLGPDGNTAGAGKDPVAWVMRVDRADGSPLAAVVNVAVHGTVGEAANPLASTDAPGAIARALASELGYPVLHVQGAAGDVTPALEDSREACPDSTRCLDMPVLEILGARAAELLLPLVGAVETEDRVALEVVTRTFPVGRGGVVRRPDGRELYYLPPDPDYAPDGVLFDDDGRAAVPFDEFNTAFGAGLCGNPEGGTFAPLPGSAGLGPYASCLDLDGGASVIFSVFDLPDVPMPICDSVRATGAAVRFSGLASGDWLMVGIPGEPTAPFAAYLRARSPAGPDRTLLVGYADEYTGYMLTSEDWLSGGYECSTNLWGPREGEQVLEELVRAMGIAWTPELEDPEAGTTRLAAFDLPPASDVVPIATTDHGTPLPAGSSMWWPDTADGAAPPQPAAIVPRAVGVARFGWLGGDPAVDFPEVIVEREIAPGRFAPVVGATGAPASSREGAVVITYAPDPLESATPARHRYGATWQPVPPDPFSLAAPSRPFALPLGTYRLRASGRALTGAGPVDYSVASASFEVAAAPLAPGSSAVRGATEIVVQASLGAAPGMRALRDGPSDVGAPLLGPWQVTVTFDDATTAAVAASPDANGTAAVVLPPADLVRAVSIDVRDAAGNGGVLGVL